MGSAAQILDFQNVLSRASSGVIRSICISLRTPSIHLPLGLPLGLFPGTLMSPTALTSFSSILCMCPYQRSLISLTFSCMLLTPSSFLMSTLFTLFLNVTPRVFLSIFNLMSVLCILFQIVNDICMFISYTCSMNISFKILMTQKHFYKTDILKNLSSEVQYTIICWCILNLEMQGLQQGTGVDLGWDCNFR